MRNLSQSAPVGVVLLFVAGCCWLEWKKSVTPWISPVVSLVRLSQGDILPAIRSASKRDPFATQIMDGVPSERLALDAKLAKQDGDPDLLLPSPEELMEKMKLSATFVQGDRQQAVINGKLLRRGESIPVQAAAWGSARLEKVHPTKVVLQINNQSFQLHYEEDSSPPNSAAAFPVDQPGAAREVQSPDDASVDMTTDREAAMSIRAMMQWLQRNSTVSPWDTSVTPSTSPNVETPNVETPLP